MSTEENDFWPARQHPNKWVVMTHFYDTLAVGQQDPNVFSETPFPSEEAARRYAAELKAGMGLGAFKVLPPVTAKS